MQSPHLVSAVLADGSDGPFDLVLGLPSHVLVVHAAVVLVPLAAIGAVLVALSAGWRERLRWVVLVLAAVGTAATFVAVRSGEALMDRFDLHQDPLVQDHQALGEVARWWVLLFLVVLVGFLVLDRRLPAREERDGRARTWFRVAAGALVLTAAIATVQVVLTGHAGSRAVWEQRVDFTLQQ
jgi:hypothetical protein